MVPSTQHLSGRMTTFRPMGRKENDVWVWTEAQNLHFTRVPS